MSNISELNALSRAVDDYQDNINAQARKKREADSERLDEIEEAYKNEVSKKTSRYEDKLKESRDEYDEALYRERDRTQKDLADFRQKMYDRFGRQSGNTAEDLQIMLNETQEAMKSEKKADQERFASQQAYYLDREKSANLNHKNEMSEAIAKQAQATRASISEQRQAEAARNRTEAEGQRRKFDQIIDGQNQAITHQKRVYDQARTDTELDFQHQLQKREQSSDNRMAEMYRNYNNRVKKEVETQREGHQRESNEIRSQMRDLIAQSKEYTKGRAEGAREALIENETESREKARAIQLGFEDELAKLKQQAKVSDTYSAELFDSTLKAKDRKFADIISSQNLANRQREREQAQNFETALSQQEIEKKRTQDYYEGEIRKDRDRAQSNQQRALQTQAEAYQGTITNNRSAANDRINNLENELLKRNTSSDYTLVSPAAERAIREPILMEQDRLLTEEQARNQRAFGEHQEKSRTQLTELRSESQALLNKVSKTFAEETQRNRREFSQYLEASELDKHAAIRQLTEANERDLQNLEKNFNRALDAQRRHFDAALDAQKEDAMTRQSLLRQDADFEAKTLRREFSTKYGDMVRDFQIQLTDQKVEYESMIREMKEELDRTRLDHNRQIKKALDEQGKNYEHRIAQMEFQQKDRERYLTQNFEDEMSKVRKANAALAKKKG